VVRLIELDNRKEQVIVWRRHLLSGLMDSLPEKILRYEPVLRPVTEWDDHRLKITETDRRGVSWKWDGWEKIDIVACLGGDEVAKVGRVKGDRNFVHWNFAVSSSDGGPVVFYDRMDLRPWKNNSPGLTERVRRPALVENGLVDFKLLPGRVPQQKRIRVILLNPNLPVAKISVQRFQLDGDRRFYAETQRPMRNREEDVPAGDLHGVIATLVDMGKHGKRLLDACFLNPLRNEWRYLTDEEAIELRGFIDGHPTEDSRHKPADLNLFLADWPQSRPLLQEIYDLAAQLTSESAALRLIKENITGLLRALVVRICGFSRTVYLDQLADQLKDGDFFIALRKLLPALPGNFKDLSPSAQRWMIQHADDSLFPETVGWGAEQDEISLDSARELIPLRKRALEAGNVLQPPKDVFGILHPRAGAFQQMENLLQEIQQAPRKRSQEQWQQSRWESFVASTTQIIEKIESRIAEDDDIEDDKINPETDSPVTRKKFTLWFKKVELMNLWRRKLGQILDYCEQGIWQSSNLPPSSENLEIRLNRMQIPARQPRNKPNLEQTREVERFIRELLESQKNEPCLSLRDVAIARLEGTIKPYSGIWGAIHNDLQQARGAMQNNPGRFAFFETLFGRQIFQEHPYKLTGVAQMLLEVIEAVENRVRSRRKTWLTTQLGDLEQLRDIMFNPDHHRIEASYRRYQELRELLCVPRYTGNFPIPALPRLDPPPSNAAERWDDLPRRFSNYWKSIEEIDRQLDFLELGLWQHRRMAREMKEKFFPVIEKFVRSFDRSFPDKLPEFYEGLKNHYLKCYEEGDDLCPKTVDELALFLDSHPEWRKYIDGNYYESERLCCTNLSEELQMQ
jgi:hypothetical protein